MRTASAVCPRCGQKLNVKAPDHVSTGMATCPKCGTKINVTFTAPSGGGGFAAPQQAPQPGLGSDTILPEAHNPGGMAGPMGGTQPIDPTVVGGGTQFPPGGMMKKPRLVYNNGVPMALKEGQNLVGRAASGSPAQIQIPTRDVYCSRQQSIITVVKMPSGMLRTFLRDHMAKNKTKINGKALLGGEEVVLKHGDQLRMGDTIVMYYED